MHKVLIHELIHALDIDFYHVTKANNKLILKKFNLDNSKYINIFEAYTETWAIIFYSLLNSLYKSNSENEIIDIAIKSIHVESVFSLYQVSKILIHQGIYDIQDIIGSNIKNKKFRQRTSVFSYFIVKSLLLLNIDKFLSFCISNNGSKTPWNYKSDSDKFIKFVLDLFTASNFSNIINKIIDKIINTKYIDTLRMSVIKFG